MGSSKHPVNLQPILGVNQKADGCEFKVSAVLQAFDENE